MGNTSCSDEAVASVLDRALAIQLHPVAPPNHTTDVGLVSCGSALSLLAETTNCVASSII